MPTMRFTKMQGAGNDYVYIDCFAQAVPEDVQNLAIRISDRHFGVGGDGLVLIEPSESADARMRMFNADGSEAEMCGNGIRCLAKYAVEEGLVAVDAEEVTIETLNGVLTLQLFREGGVVTAARVDMGPPRFEPLSLPAHVEGKGPVLDLPLEVDGMQLSLTLVSMGNPHAIHYVDDVDSFPLERIGPLVEHHELFPRRTNFQIVQVLDQVADGEIGGVALTAVAELATVLQGLVGRHVHRRHFVADAVEEAVLQVVGAVAAVVVIVRGRRRVARASNDTGVSPVS